MNAPRRIGLDGRPHPSTKSAHDTFRSVVFEKCNVSTVPCWSHPTLPVHLVLPRRDSPDLSTIETTENPDESDTRENESSTGRTVDILGATNDSFTDTASESWRPMSTVCWRLPLSTPIRQMEFLDTNPERYSRPCSSKIVNEYLSSNQFVLGVRMPLSLVSPPLIARPPPEIVQPRRLRPKSPDIVHTTSMEGTKDPHLQLTQVNTQAQHVVPSEVAATCHEPSGIHVAVSSKTSLSEQPPAAVLLNIPRVTFVEQRDLDDTQRSNGIKKSTGTSGSKELEGQPSTSCIDPKLSPSAQFPGWCVITDDEEEEVRTGSVEEGEPTQVDIISTSDQKKRAPARLGPNNEKVKEHKENRRTGELSPQEGARYTDTVESDCKEPVDDIISPSKSTILDNAALVNKPKKRTETEQQNAQDTQVPVKRSAAGLFCQRRKSLATIFSNLSSNLGFTTHAIHATPSSPPETSSLSSVTEAEHLPMGGLVTHSAIRRSLTGTVGSRLLRMKRGTSGIRLSKLSSLDQTQSQMNGDIGRLKVSEGRPSRSSEALLNSPLSAGYHRHYTTGDPITERSLFVDLLCCTCCKQVDEEAAYSNLIENHKLARFITMVAVLTILGLVLAYIIRSAMEAPQSGNTTDPTPITNDRLVSSGSNMLLVNHRPVERVRLFNQNHVQESVKLKDMMNTITSTHITTKTPSTL